MTSRIAALGAGGVGLAGGAGFLTGAADEGRGRRCAAAAMLRGAAPERTREASSWNVTSRTWNRRFSICQWSRESCSSAPASSLSVGTTGDGVDHLSRAVDLKLADALDPADRGDPRPVLVEARSAMPCARRCAASRCGRGLCRSSRRVSDRADHAACRRVQSGLRGDDRGRGKRLRTLLRARIAIPAGCL